MSKAVYIVFTVILLAWAVYSGYLFYAGSCQQIKDFPIPMYVPNRCIS